MRAFTNLSIRTKAFAASLVLLLCLIGVGGNAYFSSGRAATDIEALIGTNLPRQQLVARLETDVTAIHLKVFRYVSWASNSVSESLLRSLRAETRSDLRAMKDRIDALRQRGGLAPAERELIETLAQHWDKYSAAANDTLDVGTTDAPMATMMLGGTDDDFQKVGAGLETLSAFVDGQTASIGMALAGNAKANQRILAFGVGVLGMLALVMYARRVETVEGGRGPPLRPGVPCDLRWDVAGGVAAAAVASVVYIAMRASAIDAVGASRFTGLIVARTIGYLVFGAARGMGQRLPTCVADEARPLRPDRRSHRAVQRPLLHAGHRFRDGPRPRYHSIFPVVVVDVPAAPLERLVRRAHVRLLRELGRLLGGSVREVDRMVHRRNDEHHRLAAILPETGPEGRGCSRCAWPIGWPSSSVGEASGSTPVRCG